MGLPAVPGRPGPMSPTGCRRTGVRGLPNPHSCVWVGSVLDRRFSVWCIHDGQNLHFLLQTLFRFQKVEPEVLV
eukprot:825642-Heterocapsa_arctica.AAC.1